MAERAHWSYSQLSQFLRCPLQYYFQRVLKLTRPFLSSGQALGSAVHQTLAQYHRHLQQGRPGVPVHLAETFHEAWAEQERETIQYRPGENRESVMAQGIALLEAYLQQPPPAGIVAVEREVTVPLQNSRGKVLEKPLVAVLDLVCAAEGELTVVELKTSGRKYSQAQSSNSRRVKMTGLEGLLQGLFS